MNAIAAKRDADVIAAIRKDGFYMCDGVAMLRACLRLHIKDKILDRDPRDGNRFTFSEKGQAMYPAIATPESDRRETQRIAFRRPIDSIDVGTRLRPVDQTRVEALKSSIRELGLKTPITVFGTPLHSRARLSAGGHRLEAMRQLGEKFIFCFHENGDALDAELWEIDENLARNELTPADRALHVHRRKEIYLLKHPETANGGDRKSDRQVGELKNSDAKRFTAATAEATGKSERAVQRDAERGSKITEMALHLLRGTRLNNGAFLDRLKQVPEEHQELYVKAAIDDEKKKAADTKENRTAKMTARREVRTSMINFIAERGKMTAGEMPRAAFPVGYADPPWQQEAWSDDTGQDRGLMYPSMPLDDIKALCAGDRSPFTRDSLLHLWVPSNRIDDGVVVLRDWGFEFVTIWTWDKEDMGMGRWLRDQTEHILIGKRGDFPGLIPGTQPRSLYREKKSEHSRKPVFFAEEIDRLYPDMRKLELFQRRESLADGDIRLNGKWHFWGFEASDAPQAEAAE